jgi:cytochrome c556
MLEVWARPEEFEARIQDLQDAAKMLHAAVQAGDREAAVGALPTLILTCGACHSAFKLPAALPF